MSRLPTALAVLCLILAAMPAVATAQQTATPLLFEDFSSLEPTLRPAQCETSKGLTFGWSHMVPDGWTRAVAPEMPQGMCEWQGWAATTVDFWAEGDDQDRSSFSRGQGAVMVADPDEWDDLAPGSAAGRFDSTLTTAAADMSGVSTAHLGFATHFKPFGAQLGTIDAVFDDPDGTRLRLITYGSDAEGTTNRGGSLLNHYQTVEFAVPDGAASMVLEIRLSDAGNDWYWAFDDLLVDDEPIDAPEPPAQGGGNEPPVTVDPVAALDVLRVPQGDSGEPGRETLGDYFAGPYLQDPGTDRMTVMFEPAQAPTNAVVAYRPLGSDGPFTEVVAEEEHPAPAVGVPAMGVRVGGTGIFRASLTGLDANTVHEYRVSLDGDESPLMRFKTWPAPTDGVADGNFVVISDIQSQQITTRFPLTLESIITEKCDGEILDCAEKLDGIIIPGDLTDSGTRSQWRNDFFQPGSHLWRHVPIIITPGNHDVPTTLYLDYFHAPDNGSATFGEQWFSHDFGNLRILTAQSNGDPGQEQVDFMAARLAEAADPASGIDYLLLNLHHPCKSELWIPGESSTTCRLVRMLEQHSAETGDITGHLFGHTHGYSRGQSRDVSHLWMNAASASAATDDWGEYQLADYDEFNSTHNEWGYSELEVRLTGAPALSSRRQTGGWDHCQTVENCGANGIYPNAFSPELIRDDFVIGGDNTAPSTPVITAPRGLIATTDVIVEADYIDADGDDLLEAHWVVADAAGVTVVDAWGNDTRPENQWYRANLNEGYDATSYRVPHLEAGDYCATVRFRDDHWAWSDWAAESCFTVPELEVSENLVTNGDAETGDTEGWGEPSFTAYTAPGNPYAVAPHGYSSNIPGRTLEALAAGDCGGAPASGDHFFSVGGCRDSSSDSAVAQMVDVSASASAIDAGRVTGVLQAATRTASKWDPVSARITAFDANGDALVTSVALSNQTAEWVDSATSMVLPAGTRSVEVLLTGVSQSGGGTQAFVDDIRFRTVTSDVSRTAGADVTSFGHPDGNTLATIRGYQLPWGVHTAG